jgi:hypothetical protein
MSVITNRLIIGFWHFQCPECGISDKEIGHLAPAHAILCEVCLEENRNSPLRRWPLEEPMDASMEEPASAPAARP